MATVIRSVPVAPDPASDLVVYRRSDIQRFVEASRRTVARLEAELEAARAHNAEVDRIIAGRERDMEALLGRAVVMAQRSADAEIERAKATARAEAEAELRERVDPWVRGARRVKFSLPDWRERPTPEDDTAYFESLRDESHPLDVRQPA